MDWLDEIVRRRFPEHLVDPNAFEGFYDEVLDGVLGPANDLVEELTKALARLRVEVTSSEGVARDCWQLFGELDPVKSPASARSKLARDLELAERAEGSQGPRLDVPELERLLLGFSDLARCRVVCVLNQDVQRVVDLLAGSPPRTGNLVLGSFPLRSYKDFVFEPARRGSLHGHRARQLTVDVPAAGAPSSEGEAESPGKTFHFEIQVMTSLQHAWDRRNHPMYEWGSVPRRGVRLRARCR